MGNARGGLMLAGIGLALVIGFVLLVWIFELWDDED